MKPEHRTVTLLLIAALACALLSPAALADALPLPWDSWQVDYYVYVTTPDGGLNMRQGPSVDYDIITTLPDYVQIHIVMENSSNWGYAIYGNYEGWVFLGQTSPELPPEAFAAATPAPTPAPTPEPAPMPTPEPTPSPSPTASPAAATPNGAPGERVEIPKDPLQHPEASPGQEAVTAAPTPLPEPENSSPLKTTTFIIVLLCAVIILLASIIIFMLLKKKR